MVSPVSLPEALDTTAEIETPEHVRFRYHIAGPAKRALAYVIDLIVRIAIAAACFVAMLIGGFAGGQSLTYASLGLSLVVIFFVEWAYYVLLETLWGGRSVGKRALSLRVVTQGGHPLSFFDSVLRNLLRAADLLPAVYGFGAYAVGLVVMGRDHRFRRLGDLAAGTLVICENRSAVAAPLHLNPPPTPAELRSLPQRLPLDGDELDAIELFLRRLGRLSVSREFELAEMVAPVFAARLGVRYKDPVRFLGLLHYRAHEHESAPPISVGTARPWGSA